MQLENLVPNTFYFILKCVGWMCLGRCYTHVRKPEMHVYVLLCHPPPYSLEAGYLTEPGAGLAVSKTQ